MLRVDGIRDKAADLHGRPVADRPVFLDQKGFAAEPEVEVNRCRRIAGLEGFRREVEGSDADAAPHQGDLPRDERKGVALDAVSLNLIPLSASGKQTGVD